VSALRRPRLLAVAPYLLLVPFLVGRLLAPSAHCRSSHLVRDRSAPAFGHAVTTYKVVALPLFALYALLLLVLLHVANGERRRLRRQPPSARATVVAAVLTACAPAVALAGGGFPVMTGVGFAALLSLVFLVPEVVLVVVPVWALRRPAAAGGDERWWLLYLGELWWTLLLALPLAVALSARFAVSC
jgi:hypothetical protein